MLKPLIPRHDKLAASVIGLLSLVVFVAVAVLGRIELDLEVGFDVHLFARINAIINTLVSVLLVAGLIAVRRRRLVAHQRIMLAAMLLSTLFLVSYIGHHLLAGETHYGGEGVLRWIYYLILVTHIVLAALILPFILYTAYRAAVADWAHHRRLARLTWPVWFYVSVTGVVIYLMISPHYA